MSAVSERSITATFQHTHNIVSTGGKALLEEVEAPPPCDDLQEPWDFSALLRNDGQKDNQVSVFQIQHTIEVGGKVTTVDAFAALAHGARHLELDLISLQRSVEFSQEVGHQLDSPSEAISPAWTQKIQEAISPSPDAQL